MRKICCWSVSLLLHCCVVVCGYSTMQTLPAEPLQLFNGSRQTGLEFDAQNSSDGHSKTDEFALSRLEQL